MKCLVFTHIFGVNFNLFELFKVLDGSVITAKRTAAVSAIATKVSKQSQFVVLYIK